MSYLRLMYFGNITVQISRCRCRCQWILDRLTSISALIIGEGYRQGKTEILSYTCHHFTWDLCPAGVVGLDGIIPICASQLNGIHALINGIAKCQCHFWSWHRGRCLHNGVDKEGKTLTQTIG